VLSADEGMELAKIGIAVRRETRAPLILFRGTDGEMGSGEEFDLIVDCLVSPLDWLRDLTLVIARNHALSEAADSDCGASRTSAALTEAKEIVTTLSRSFQERQVEEALFARQG